MIIELHSRFKKSYQKRIASNSKLVKQTAEKISLFQKNPHHPSLNNHNLTGKKVKLKSFSVSGDIRIVYFAISKNKVLFLDIGSHNQVY